MLSGLVIRFIVSWLLADTPTSISLTPRTTANLKKHIVHLGETLGTPYREDAGMVSQCAGLLNYWTEEEDGPEGAGPVVVSRHPQRPAGSQRGVAAAALRP
jgi:hypothetical protein